MIQRIQTVWLLLASLLVFLTLKFSFYSGTLVFDNTYDSLIATDNIPLMILTSALGTMLFINIFLFRKRSLQFRFCLLGILLECLVIFLYYRQLKLYSKGTFDLWASFHLLAILFIILAMRGIHKDSKIIKDSERLR